MYVPVLFLAAFSCVCNVNGNTLPSFIKPCSASDPNVNQCITNVIQETVPKFSHGIPSLGIATLDPVQLGTINVDNPALKLVFTDTVVSGLGGSKINSYVLNPQRGNAILDFTANVTLKAHYDMDGQILILPIRGNGQAKIKITNLKIIINYDYKTVDGHWTVPKYKDSYSMDKAVFKFSNLFGGNKQLSETTQKFANYNWQIIMDEIAPPAIKEIIRRCVLEVEKFFKAVPAEDLLLA